jgi:hypothetical protein
MSSQLEVSLMMNNMMTGMMRSVAHQVIDGCAAKYGFDASEAKEQLQLNVSQAAKKLSSEKPKKEAKMKVSFPLPFNGEHSDKCCQALRQNNGLYTQCQATRKGEYCKSCQQLADKSIDGIPEYGTISMRLATNPYDYVDPKGRKPTSYTKVMKKYNLTPEQVLEEAAKFGITIDVAHFVVPEETKRGRPAKAPKEPKEAKAVKGRPKKSTKIIALADDEEDLFASLVAQASSSEVTEEPQIDKEAEKAAKKAALEAEKEAKKLALEAEKAAKAEKLAQEKAAKEAKLAADKAEKEAKKLALEAEKEAKKLALEQEKAAKAEKLAQEKAAKEAAKAATKEKKTPKTKEPVVEEEETYKKCTGQDGKKYIRSQQTNIVYDLDIYTAKEELVPVGKWIADSKSIVFNKADDSDSELEDDEVDE